MDENSIMDGFSAQQIFSSPGSRGYTFDDLIVLPSQITFGVDDVDLNTRVTRRISLASPFVSRYSLAARNPLDRGHPVMCLSSFSVRYTLGCQPDGHRDRGCHGCWHVASRGAGLHSLPVHHRSSSRKGAGRQIISGTATGFDCPPSEISLAHGNL